MSDLDRPGADLHLDCQTCVAVNTTACNDCIVSHVLANDDGPIEFVVDIGRVAERASRADPVADPVADAVDLLGKAGLLDDPPAWVSRAEFEGAALTSVR